ncbi:MAG: CRTAC1 family protein [Proteobacteria bacterium]|nr:CRTAC1 family protein [Pseudomonadota bacterium]MBI3499645.1 CRTAC1 family protein [Pseudomonadota bacterium]
MFRDASAELIDNAPALRYGIAVTDIDGDGKFEAVVAGHDGPNQVLKWTGKGFEDIADRTIADAERQAIGVAAGDIDGDGREEIYVLNADSDSGPKEQGDRLFACFGSAGAAGPWLDLFQIPDNRAATNQIAGRSVAVVDRLGSGRYGFVVANHGGPFRLFELTEGKLVDHAAVAGIDRVTGGRGLVAGPIVSPRMDIFAVNENGPNFLFVNRGDGSFSEEAERRGLADAEEHGRGVTALDLDGDGRLDLVYGNWEGPHRLFLQDANGRFKDTAPAPLAQPSRVRTVLAADFDNDGVAELFFNNIGQANRLFKPLDGGWVQIPTGAAEEARGLGTGAAVGDFDDDGRLELLIAHGESRTQRQRLSLFRPLAAAANFLRVMPLTRYGAPARGALVRLEAGETVQVRLIDAGSGYLCQMEPVAHFGLGPFRTVDRLTVRWPDGAFAVIERPQANQRIVVRHPAAVG